MQLGISETSEASEATITDERYNRRVEEEAISKLERLGYPRNWERNKRTVAFFVVHMGFNLLFVYVLYLYIYTHVNLDKTICFLREYLYVNSC